MRVTLARVAGAAWLCMLVGMGGIAPAGVVDPLADSGRTILLDVRPGAPTDWVQFGVPADFNPRFDYYSMLVELPKAGEWPHLWINGRHLTNVPIPGGDGQAIYGLPGGFLRPGEENTIRFSGADGAAVHPDRVAVFELYGGAEAAHADLLFGAERLRALERSAPPAHSSQAQFDVQHYDLWLDLDINSRQIAGTMTMEAVSLVDGLAQVGLDFRTGTQSGATMSVTGAAMVPPVPGVTFSTNTANGWVVVNLPESARPGEGEVFTISVDYAGTPLPTPAVFNRDSYQRTFQPQPSGAAVLHTISEPYAARGWWPSKDDIADKATIDLRISVQNPNEVVTNGVLMTTTAEGGNRTRYHWSHNHPVATYLVAFVATQFLSDSITYTALDGVTEMDITHWVYQTSAGELNALPDTLDVMEFFAGLFGEYPFLDEKYGTMAWGISFGMEHQTITSLPNGELASGGKSRRNVHELAHMWFGDMVSLPNFDHLWLKEGWATFTEALYEEHDLGRTAYFSRINNFISSGVGLEDNIPLVNPNAGNTFQNNLYYRKGAVVLHMLRGVMGDEAFFEGTREYLRRHAFGTADTEDFREVMEEHHGAPLVGFFDRWVHGTGRPSYAWGWGQTGDTLNMTVNQTQAGPAFPMPIPFLVTFSDGTEETIRLFNGEKAETLAATVGARTVLNVAFDPEGWIYKGTVTQLGATPDPVIRMVRQGADPTTIRVSWESGGGATTGFDVLTSPDRSTWTVAASVPGTETTTTIGGIIPGTLVNVAVRGTGGGTPSVLSNVYAVRTSFDNSADRVLVVEGYERWNSQAGRPRNHPWAAVHGEAIHAYGLPFDTVSNRSVLPTMVRLGDYRAVVWNLGEESTADHTFDNTEQAQVREYLRAGGKLFVSGAEIGWDLGRTASVNASLDFYFNFLKAVYVRDNAQSYVVNGVAGSIMEGLSSVAFDDGSAGIYFQGWPDEIDPNTGAGATAALRYANGRGAAVQFEGIFPGGWGTGHLVYLGFAFETFVDQAQRHEVMARSLAFFGLEPDDSAAGVGDQFVIY